MRLLLVEDDPMIGASVQRGLRQDGHTVDTAGTGGEGLALLRDIYGVEPERFARNRARLADAREPDRFEREGAEFFERTREAYHARAKADPGRIHIVDSTQSIDQIRTELEAGLRALLAVPA